MGGRNCTIQEEHEWKLINDGLTYEGNKWITSYPWKRDPYELPNNEKMILHRLESTERGLRKDQPLQEAYQEQMRDMLEREVSRKLTKDELDSYKGPIYYISHHAILNPKSSSTPCRIVFNTSEKYQGHQLNEYWAKGPDQINNLLGIILRFREYRVVLMGDVKKCITR